MAEAFTLFFLLALAAGFCFVSNYGLWRMAAHAGIPRPWVAFLPLGDRYIQGLLAERSRFVRLGKRSRLSLWNPLVWAVLPFFFLLALGADGDPYAIFALFLLWVIGAVFSLWASMADIALFLLILLAGKTDGDLFALLLGGWILSTLLTYGTGLLCIYHILRDYSPRDAVLLTVLCAVVRQAAWIVLFACRDVVPVSVTGPGEWPYGRPKYDKYHQWSLPGPCIKGR